MAFKLAVGNMVQVPVRFSLRDGALDKNYTLTLTATRHGPDDIAAMESVTVNDFMLAQVSGWSGTHPVLAEDGTPAPYSSEALAFLLKVPGVLDAVWLAYLRECGAKTKN